MKRVLLAALSTAVIPEPESFILYSKNARTSSCVFTLPSPPATVLSSPIVTVNTSAPIETL